MPNTGIGGKEKDKVSFIICKLILHQTQTETAPYNILKLKLIPGSCKHSIIAVPL